MKAWERGWTNCDDRLPPWEPTTRLGRAVQAVGLIMAVPFALLAAFLLVGALVFPFVKVAVEVLR